MSIIASSEIKLGMNNGEFRQAQVSDLLSKVVECSTFQIVMLVFPSGKLSKAAHSRCCCFRYLFGLGCMYLFIACLLYVLIA